MVKDMSKQSPLHEHCGYGSSSNAARIREQLTRFQRSGGSHSGSQLNVSFSPGTWPDSALQVGVTQFKVDFTTLRDWYNKEHWLRENAVVAVAAGEDGLSGFQQDGAWRGYREEITRFIQMLFSGRSGERATRKPLFAMNKTYSRSMRLWRATLRSFGLRNPLVRM